MAVVLASTGSTILTAARRSLVASEDRRGALIADKAYDSNAFRSQIAQAGMQVVIPSNRTRKLIIPHDRALYKERNRIERCFNKLKHFRRFATRFDRLDACFLAFIHLAAAMIWMR